MTGSALGRGMLSVCGVLVGALLVGGCGGGGEQYVFLNVRERPSWGPDGRIAVAALGGDANLYIWSVREQGGGSTLLTRRPTNPTEAAGGRHPAYSADGAMIAFSGHRQDGTLIRLMDARRGDAAGLVVIDTTALGDGEDICPSWTSAGTLLFSSSRPDGDYDLWQANATAPFNPTRVVDLPGHQLWPMERPGNANQIVYEERDPASGYSHVCLYDRAAGAARVLVGSPTDQFRDGGPCWAPDGSYVLFHSNRAGDFDIWRVAVNADGSPAGPPTRITSTPDSDGYPVFEMGAASEADWRVAFIRGNELWTMRPDGTDLRRVTRMYR
jgi:Tol biopolymer transport system component